MDDPVTHLEAIYAFIIKNNATELNCPTSVFALWANMEPQLEHRWEDQIRDIISQISGQPLHGDQSLAISQPRKPPTGKHKAKKVHFESHTETNNHIRYFCPLEEDRTKIYANPKDVTCLCLKKKISKLSQTGFRATITGNEWWRVFKGKPGKAGRWPKSEIIKTTKVFPPPTSSPDQDSTATLSVVWPESPTSSSEATGKGPILAFDVSGYGIISVLVHELQACMRTSDPFWLHVEQPSHSGRQKWWQDNFYSVINIIFKATYLFRFGHRLWGRYKKQCHKYLPENIEKIKDMLWFTKALDTSSKALSGSQDTTAQKMLKIMTSLETLSNDVGRTDDVVDPFVALVQQLGGMDMMAERITRDLLDILESEPESESCPNSDIESSYGPISPSPLTILRPKIPALLSAISHLRGWIESSEKACRENGRVLNKQKYDVYKEISRFMKQFLLQYIEIANKRRVSPDAGDCKQSAEQGRGKGQLPCEQPQQQSSAEQSAEQSIEKSTEQSTERLQEPNPKETDSPSSPKEETARAASKAQFPIPDSLRPLFSQVIKKLEQMDELNEQVGRQFIQNFKTLRAIQKTIGNTGRFDESEERTPASSGCSSRSNSPLREDSLQQNISPSGTAVASTVASTIACTLKICDTALTRPMEVAESPIASSSTSFATSHRTTLRQSETCSSDSDDEKKSVSDKGKKEKSKKKEKKERGKEKGGGKAGDSKKRKKSPDTTGTSTPKTTAATTKKSKKSNPKELHSILKKTEGNSYIWVDKTQVEKFRLEFEDARRVLLAAKEEKLESKKEEKVEGK